MKFLNLKFGTVIYVVLLSWSAWPCRNASMVNEAGSWLGAVALRLVGVHGSEDIYTYLRNGL